jgi:hypothetical protein
MQLSRRACCSQQGIEVIVALVSRRQTLFGLNPASGLGPLQLFFVLGNLRKTKTETVVEQLCEGARGGSMAGGAAFWRTSSTARVCTPHS